MQAMPNTHERQFEHLWNVTRESTSTSVLRAKRKLHLFSFRPWINCCAQDAYARTHYTNQPSTSRTTKTKINKI